ncbi:MAG: nucleoside deaminase, partial [Desulfovibrio sp.]|nr:nucleoside deaminase [Desulfovibrio sp.]
VMIVTLEPCLMCAAAIRLARLSGVVFGCLDALEGAIVSRSDFIALTGHKRHIWHLGGVLATRCAALLTNFFNEKRRLDSGRSHERTGIS